MRAHMQIPSERLARGPAPDEWARIDPVVYLTAARRLQARATSEAIVAGWRRVRRGVTGLASLLQDRLLEPIARRSQRQRALAELAALDDRLLADIGLQRSDIALAVDGRLADPRVARRASAPDLRDRLLRGERCPTPTAIANSDRPVAPAAPDQARELAA